MELSDYGRLLRKWALLIIAGTVLAGLVGLGLDIKSGSSAAPSYQGSASVFLNYVTPPGSAYNPTVSPTAEALALAERVHDPAALAPLRGSPTFNLAALKSIGKTIASNAPQVNITTVATTPQVAATVATRVAQYLASLEDRRVASEGKALQRSLARTAQRASHRYQVADSEYLRVCACGPGATGAPLVGPQTLRRMRARLDLLEYDYQTAYSSLQGANPNPIPPASVSSGSVHRIATKKSSITKTVLPAVVLGFILSLALAAFLDYAQSRSMLPVIGVLPGRSNKGKLRVPVIGHLPSPSLRLDGKAKQLLQDNAARAQVLAALGKSAQETADVVARLVGKTNPTLYITSPTHRDPKAETTLSLACALTQRDLRVVIVDGDPAGGLSSFLGFEDRPGLADFLAYPEMSLTQLLQRVDYNTGTPVGSLWLLPIGLDLNPTAATSSFGPFEISGDAWSQGLREVSDAADIVLVNGVSALEAPSAIGLATSVGGALVVIRKEHADEGLLSTYELLRGHGIRVLGLVVNAGDRGLARHAALEALPKHSTASQLAEPELQETS